MDKTFDLYAQYYNLLYQDKDYLAEVDYLESLLKKYSKINILEILDLGCGTGSHDILLAEKGYKITGIDLSEKMIGIAKNQKNQNADFLVGDVRNINLNKQFDIVISLFHVASYQTTNNDFEQYLQTAYNHLKPGGIFIFDFWYGPAVLTDLPQKKRKKVENDELVIVRNTEPVLKPNENIVEVNFDVSVHNKTTGTVANTTEVHKMRYWFLPELLSVLEKNKFSSICQYKWMTENNLSLESWYGLIVASK